MTCRTPPASGRLQAAVEAGTAHLRRLLDDPQTTVGAAARLIHADGSGEQAMVDADTGHFPASLVKLFHAVSFFRAVAEGRLVENGEDRGALEALLRLSSNAADQYLLRRLCPPPPEDELSPPPAFIAAREELTRAWHRLDPVAFAGLRVSNATWVDGPFGAEAEARRRLGRNRMTARAGLAVLEGIAGAWALVPPADALRLRGWLDREWARPPHPSAGTAGQVDGFLAQALPVGAKVWSKGGWTEETRHDAAHATFSDGSRLMLVTLVSGRGLWGRDDLLPAFARELVARL